MWSREARVLSDAFVSVSACELWNHSTLLSPRLSHGFKTRTYLLRLGSVISVGGVPNICHWDLWYCSKGTSPQHSNNKKDFLFFAFGSHLVLL